MARDIEQSADWYRAAGEQGSDLGQLRLAELYSTGLGVPRNNVVAYAWFNVAAASTQQTELSPVPDPETGLTSLFGGYVNHRAQRLRNGLASQMTPEQISEAQRLSVQIMENIQNKQSRGGSP